MVTVYYGLFNQSLVIGHLGYFPFGAIMNKAAVSVWT